jgi:threonine synthase
VEPASVASVTALQSLMEQGWIKPHERVACLLTGAGFKDSKLAETEAEAISRQIPVPFDAGAIVAEVRKYKSPPLGWPTTQNSSPPRGGEAR